MKSFTDTKGREWHVEINVGVIKRVRDKCDVNLLNIADEQVTRELSTDLVKLVDVLYVIVKPQADEAGVSDEDFGAAMGGDALDDAVMAFRDEWVGFFPKARRETLRKALAKEQEMEEAALKRVEAAMDDPKISQAMDAMVDRQIASALTRLNDSSTNSPESSG